MKFIQSFIFLLLNSEIFSFFKNVKLITEINNIKNLTEKIEYEKRLSLILFYGNNCKYCDEFKPQYINLSLKFNKVASFIAINVDKSLNVKPFQIEGIPNIFYYYNGKYINNGYDDSYELISEKLNDNYLYKCELISIKKIEEFKKTLNQTNITNYIIGYFNNIIYENQFLDIINNYTGYIDKCIYTIDVNHPNNSIYTFNKQRNKEYIMTNFEKLEKNLIDFIDYKVRNIYEEISEQKYTSILESQDRYFILFIYDSFNQRETYVKNIIEFNSIGINKNIKPFNFILLNLKKYITNKIPLQSNVIFIIDPILKNYTQINNISIIDNLFENISLKSFNFQNGQKYIREYLDFLEKNNTKKNQKTKENTKKRNYIFYISLLLFIFLIYVYLKVFKKKEINETNKISFGYNENNSTNYEPLNI